MRRRLWAPAYARRPGALYRRLLAGLAVIGLLVIAAPDPSAAEEAPAVLKQRYDDATEK